MNSQRRLVDGWFNQLEFTLGVASIQQLPDDNGREVAFAGRSNVGKSSAINRITRRNALARISKTPGRTRELNYFSYAQDRRLVDLPGYGFAKVNESRQRSWTKLLDHYFRHRQALKCLFLVMDSRHPLGKTDCQMLDYAHDCNIPLHILLSKADKLSRNAAQNTLRQVTEALSDYHASCQLFSALKRTGIEEARTHLAYWLFEAD